MKFLLLLAPLLLFSAQSLVEVEKIKRGTINQSQEFIGTLSFNQSSEVASELAGSIKSVEFDLGERVKKSQILATIDTSLIDAEIKSARASIKEIDADLQNAKKELERFQRLHKNQSVTDQEFDSKYFNVEKLKAKISTIEASIEELNIKKEKAKIKAPFDGVIVTKNVDIGEWKKDGDSICKIVNPTKVDALFSIPMELFEKIKVSENSKIAIGSELYDSKIDSKILEGDRLTRTFPIKVKLNLNREIFSQMEAKLILNLQSKMETFLVPKDAVIKRFNQDVVFTVQDGVANMLPVEIKGFEGSLVGVINPMLKDDSMVVTKGNERIFPNQPVEIKK